MIAILALSRKGFVVNDQLTTAGKQFSTLPHLVALRCSPGDPCVPLSRPVVSSATALDGWVYRFSARGYGVAYSMDYVLHPHQVSFLTSFGLGITKYYSEYEQLLSSSAPCDESIRGVVS